ncbi:MAG: hypothetical protein LIO95_04895 [Clostridiales bacterium]|nr:hypothetical protein [Clostridiales bacterium]
MNFSDIRFEFIKGRSDGLNDNQIQSIRSIIQEYIEKYPGMQLNFVCDFYHWDHYDEKFSIYSYLHDKDGIPYSKRDYMARYNDIDKLIGFNHIRMSNLPIENNELIQKVEDNKKRADLLERKCKQLLSGNKNLNPHQTKSIAEFMDAKESIFSEQLKKNSCIKSADFDVALIKCLEGNLFVKRLTLHEIGHAIAYNYNLADDSIIQELFDRYRDDFNDDIHEFMAQCFMASELTNSIPLANKVKARFEYANKNISTT